MRPLLLLLFVLVAATALAQEIVPAEPESQQAAAIRQRGYVTYRDFGAADDGTTDASAAIRAAHAYANRHELPVQAGEGTYYIGGKDRTAEVLTSTDFGTATFLIDDTAVENISAPVFLIGSREETFVPEGITRLGRGQETLPIKLPAASLVTVTNDSVRHYIRYGLNQDRGSAQTDIFVVDADGRVDPQTPIIWDFDRITGITARPIEEDTLYITGGRFVTVANQAESKYTYYSRNIVVERSRVVVDGLTHLITGEGEHGAPYGGFINLRNCAYVTVRNCVLTGHKTYSTIGSAGRPVSMGSYDILANGALNVSFVNCTQTNDINDRTYWGIMGSNYCKNLVYDGCVLSRFDAHKGVANATIRNSTLGHMGINAIGSGTLTVENTTVRGGRFVNLRSDYGSTWRGQLRLRDCTFVPTNGGAAVIDGHYSAQHDFGYVCYMPDTITISGLHIDDAHLPADYPGPALFADFNPERKDTSYAEPYPYILTERVILRDVTTASGKALRVSENPVMFLGVEVVRSGQ
ncbi:hypothetical protein GGR26_003618 [Lewinella marina]|uniref:Pectate lyase superfamily protein domain-containing protein n=1 Tax=Neolewinella marina TaxID=438751 RepID=A0A2G0CBG2_9BACT|nr:right-handed parallel beta-helix repeat-containing protein [Neolewinella marina]NJB87832.1 hypothetical protein [Neolewinella marina]PHK97295.1 hypothetical protein CGL56_17105 [Neolewinella marina]